jgi:L-2-hydroxycarboxylate dehydrogenase (NAD+)
VEKLRPYYPPGRRRADSCSARGAKSKHVHLIGIADTGRKPLKVTVEVELARATAAAALRLAGVPEAHAALQVDLLVEAELRGRPSHGLLRLSRIIERIHNGVCDPVTQGEHQWHGALLEVDGQDGLGPVVACAALDRLIDRVGESRVAIASIRRNNHLGMLAWYGERVARRGMILIAMCTSEALVHPWGGRTAMLGTNPIGIAVPTAAEPFVLDMATSLVSMGQIHDHANRGEPIPDHWALDAEGNRTTDATAAKSGAIAPFGEAKGYALGLALEVLVTTLATSAVGRDVRGTLDSDQPCNKGDVFIVIDPLRGGETARTITAYLDAIRNTPGGQDGQRAAVPGDRALRVRRDRLAHGIVLGSELWQRLQILAATAEPTD